MNREIKFRQAIFLNGKFHSFHYWGFLKNDNNFTSPGCNNQEAFKNSQEFTGLKDKNGVEIYEGDIVSYSTKYYGTLKAGRVQTVKWMEDMEHDGFGQPTATGFLLYGYDWKVIGNIFENPELLQQPKVD